MKIEVKSLTDEAKERELDFYKSRNMKAKIELLYDDGINPFSREDLNVVDVGVSDNIYCVESQVLKNTQKELAELREKVQEYLNNRTAVETLITLRSAVKPD